MKRKHDEVAIDDSKSKGAVNDENEERNDRKRSDYVGKVDTKEEILQRT